MLLLHP